MKTNAYIKQVRAVGLKSGDFEHQLEQVNLIIGKSASGKTARLDAIRLGLAGGTILGRSAEFKSRTIDIMDLARNGQIEVTIQDNAGRTNSKRWMRGKQVVDVKAEIPPTPTILMDSTEYFSLSDAKKIEYAFSLAQIGDHPDFTGDGVCAALRSIRPEPSTAETEAALQEIIDLASGTNRDRIVSLEPVQKWLGDLIASLKLRLSAAKANCDRMTKMVQGITELSNVQAVANPEQQLAEARKKLQTLNAGKVGLEQQLEQVRAIIEQREDIQKKIVDLKEDPAALAVAQKQVEELEADIARIEQSALVLPSEFVVDEQALNAEHSGLQQQITGYKSATRQAREHLTSLEGKYREALAKVEQFDAETRMLIDQFEKQMAMTCCAECGAPPEHWDALHSKDWRAINHSQKLVDRDKFKSELTLELEQADEQRNKVAKILAKCEADDQEQEMRRTRASTILSTLNRLNIAKESARKERDGILKVKRAALHTARNEVAKLANVGIVRQQAEAQLAILSLDGRPSPDSIQGEISKTQSAIGQLENDIKSLEALRTAFIQQQADEQRNAQALIEHRKAQANLTVTKLAIEKCEEIQGQMVATAFESILKTVNDLSILRRIEYRDGELGYWKDATWVKSTAFSKTEEGLLFVGISLALAKDSPIKIVMLDELGRMDFQTLTDFMTRIFQLIEQGKIDQFVGAYSTAGELTITGANIIKL